MTAIAKPLIDAYTKAMADAITKAAGAWTKAEDGVTKSRVNFGRAVGKAKSAIIASGGTDEDAESLIWPTIVEAIGYRVEWKSITAWIRAANVYDSLPKEIASQFSDEALKTLGRVPVKVTDAEKADGKMTREEFAKQAVDLTVRDLREAVKAERASSSPKKEKAKASQAAETVTAMKGLVSDETLAEIESVSTEARIALVMIGVMLDRKVPKHNLDAVTEGVTEFFTPEDVAAPEQDGSDAPDA